MTVLVTGATGLLGRHVVELAAERGEQTRALVLPGDSPNGIVETGTVVVRGDVGDRDSLAAAMEGVDCVLHCAARTGPWGASEAYERVNVQGLENVVRAAMAAGVRRIVHVSSITVHGNDVHGEADETAPLRAEPNPYSRSKVAGERVLAHLVEAEQAPVTIVRPGWIYGPGDVASFARLAATIRAGRMIVVGAGDNHVPLIYVRDAARGVLLAGEADDAAGRTYLLVNDESVTQLDYLSAIAAEIGVSSPRRHVPYRLCLALGWLAETTARLAGRREPPPLTRYGIQLLGGENRFSIDRARRELGFAPDVGLAEGVRRAAEWYGNRPLAEPT